MIARQLSTPWAPGCGAYSIPGVMLLKLKLGEAPDHVPARVDVSKRYAAPAARLDGGVIDRVIRQYTDGVHISRVHAAAASLGNRGEQHIGYNDQEVVCGLSRTFRVQMARNSPIEHLTRTLNEVAVVEFATPDYLCGIPFASAAATPALEAKQSWAVRDEMFAREALVHEPGDPSILVALVDSGVVPHHPETHRRFRSGFDTVQLGQGDFANGITLLGDVKTIDTKPIDAFVGHGMACAGIIGALGQAIPPGLAGDCRMLPIRVLGAAKLPGKQNAVGLGSICDIDMGMKMAIELGARVINMSFGTADNTLNPMDPKPHADVVRYALLRGCVLVAASGNSGHEEIYWPARHEGVIAVGSVSLEGKTSSFTTHGEHLALCAVGKRCRPAHRGIPACHWHQFRRTLRSAAAALLISRAERRSYAVNPTRVRQLLIDSAAPWRDKDTKGYGSGVLNAVAALKALDREIDGSPATDGEPGAPDVSEE